MCRFATRYRPFRIAKRYISQDNRAKTAQKTEEKRFVKFIRAVFVVLNDRAVIVKECDFHGNQRSRSEASARSIGLGSQSASASPPSAEGAPTFPKGQGNATNSNKTLKND